ncbi:MAG: hypothetical protein IJ287_03185 [Methanobrevibacter sp.]|nr:hypothetical protein [Methanobrevibacter sp.]MBR1748883.1 hypothetical protein [Bacilli bacterium]
MNENKRFKSINCGLQGQYIKDNGNVLTIDDVVNRLNELNDENQDLWKIIRIYRKLATCHNCDYHDYDWYDEGDEFEVCEKGNDMSYMICSEWEEL